VKVFQAPDLLGFLMPANANIFLPEQATLLSVLASMIVVHTLVTAQD
jgi:hypothetical protein